MPHCGLGKPVAEGRRAEDGLQPPHRGHRLAGLFEPAGLARIHGGMHFSHATVAGEELGRHVAQWVAARHFRRLD